MNISFGNKIPVYQNKVYNKLQKEYENATLYEINCEDSEDLDSFLKKDGVWAYKLQMYMNMRKKHELLQITSQMPQKHRDIIKRNKFYSLELDNGNVVGHCEVTNEDDDLNINYIECNQTRNYKYAG